MKLNRITAIILALSATFMLRAQDKPFMQDLPYYVENLSVFGLNQEEGRAFHIPERSVSLNGKWKFFFADNPSEVPDGFFRPEFNDRKWALINVPSNWEMEGFGQALFRNVQAPFPMYRSEFVNQFMPQRRGPAPAAAAGPMPAPVIPLFGVGIPDIPMDVNPTGAYRTTFNLPSSWKGDHVFLRFEKVASASFVWVNGKQVGYNEGAQEPSEYDITPYVKSGRNTVAVLVLKYSDGFYLEGQDYWRLAGIFDDVTVFAVPKARIRDWQVITDFDKSFTDSDLSVAIDLKAYDVPATGLTLQAVVSRNGVRAASMEQAVPTIAAGENRTIQLRSRVTAPKKWTAETPDLYDLEMTLKDASGRVVDSVTKRIGFKKTEIIDGVFYLNGQPLKISAQCSHMQHPELGHAMDEATVRRDMEILKQFNFNAVRTSHYPPVNEYLDLADEYGLYIIDETGDEAHATEYVSNIPDFIPMYQERVRQMVLRDRNHACVIFWSAGNESGEGPDITEVVKEGRKYDPTRFWMYGGNAAKHPAEDIVGPRYPSPLEHELGYGIDRTDKRPSFMDEYVSVAGNGGGNIDEFWREIDDHPSLLGGALWDFVSPGLTEPVRILTDKSPYGTMANIMGKAKLVKGRTGKAIDMDKVDQWVQVYRADNVEIASDHLTLTLDIYPRQFNKSGGYMITKGSRQFGLRQRGADGIEFYLDNGQVRTISGKLPANWEYNWHNVTAVYDGKEMKIFVDGEQVASGEATGNIRNLPLSLCIGRNEERNGQDTNEYICDALIDNVGVFNAAVLPSDGFDPAAAALWLDFEEETNGGTFYTYGIGARTYGSIWPDRTPQPEMWQMKKSAQPMRFALLDPRSGVLEVRNRNYFTNASQYKTVWTLTADGETIASGTLNLDIAPQQTVIVKVPYTKPAIQPGKEYRLTVSSLLAEDKIWAPAGHEIAWEQFDLTDWNVPAAPKAKPAGQVQLSQNADRIVVTGTGFRYAFDAKSGELVSMEVDGKEMIASPLKVNLWRAPIANEVDGWNNWGARSVSSTSPGYGGVGHSSVLAAIYYAAGLDNIANLPIHVNARAQDGCAFIDVRELVLFGVQGEETQLDAYIVGRRLNGMESLFTYRIDADGTVTVHNSLSPQGDMPAWLPRIGVTLSLAGSLDNVQWYGRGPQASYPDRKTGYRFGIWSSTLDEMYEPYLIPQDYGLRMDNRWVRMTDASGKGLEFKMDIPFAFNAYPFTTDNLTKAVYQYQLQKADSITMNLDYATTGLGDTSRGTLPGYRAYPTVYDHTIVITPVR